jgi:periplasmic protein TonB
VFDEVLKDEGSLRLARRASYLVGSTAAQAVVVLALTWVITAMATGTPREVTPSIEVKFVKGAPRPVRSQPPPAPLRMAARALQPAPSAPLPPMVQPREIPDRMAVPEPTEPPPLAEPAVGPGVIGGLVGGADQAAQPPPRPEFDPASMSRPVFVSGPDPAYTRAALDREVEGLMVVTCVVTREGLVRDCRVQKGLPFMDAAVVQALERRRYLPARLRGEPVEVTYHFRLNLRLPQ